MLIIIFILIFSFTATAADFGGGLIFPPENWHNHSSSIVETPEGDLLICWYHGSGEGEADDVKVLGARKRRGKSGWSEPFLLADTPNLPDLNPVLFIDPRGVLWLFWTTFLDNSAGGVLIKYRTATEYDDDGPPMWEWQDIIHCRPRNFEHLYSELLDSIEIVRAEHIKENPKLGKIINQQRRAIHDKLSRRLGWMIRTQPIMTSNSRMMLGLYHDIFACSLAAFTDDWGKTWSFSEPIQNVYLGLIQPSFVIRRDDTIVAFMRDNGYPKQIRVAKSQDAGVSWQKVRAMDIPNPGKSIQCLALKNGHWILLCNDMKKGNYRLTAFLSDDEGSSWKWRRVIEDVGKGNGAVTYPTLIQSKDGSLHCTFTYKTKEKTESIKYVHFNEAWIKAGEKLR